MYVMNKDEWHTYVQKYNVIKNPFVYKCMLIEANDLSFDYIYASIVKV